MDDRLNFIERQVAFLDRRKKTLKNKAFELVEVPQGVRIDMGARG